MTDWVQNPSSVHPARAAPGAPSLTSKNNPDNGCRGLLGLSSHSAMSRRGSTGRPLVEEFWRGELKVCAVHLSNVPVPTAWIIGKARVAGLDRRLQHHAAGLNLNGLRCYSLLNGLVRCDPGGCAVAAAGVGE
ncbi:hypothetical protein GCM10027436_44320 [Actinophytocola sediminis]